VFNFLRSFTYNDVIKARDEHTKPHKLSGIFYQNGLNDLKTTTKECIITDNGKVVNVKITQSIAPKKFPKNKIGFEQVYTISANGTIVSENKVMISETIPQVPRIGVKMLIPGNFEDLQWFGRATESYIDRKAGYPIDLYKSKVSEQYVPYIVPQEHGNKEDLRWIALSGKDSGVMIKAEKKLLGGSASHFSNEHLFDSYHTYDLTAEKDIHVYIDMIQRGLGSGSCGPDTLDKYKIFPGEYSYSYKIVPLQKGDKAELLGRC
jgi:beta-galactosidase